MADNPNISGYVVVGDWNASGVYKGGQGASVVNYALTTWQAVSPRRGVPPGTIAGEWLRVPTKVQQTAPFVPPPPTPAPKPIAYTANAPLSVNGTILNVATMRASGAGAASGVVPTPPSVAGTTKFLREDATWAVTGGGGGGTVTSVALAAPAEFNVSGSPVIAAGTLTLAWANENANVAFMGPTSGGAAVPTFRAIVPADLAGTPGAGKYWDGTGTWTTLPAPGTGTVTSVGLSTDASYLTIGSTPVTTSGTITANKTTGLTANQVVATPDGAPGAADLRSLVNADLPTSGVSAASYTYTALTVNAQGIITAASSGAAPTGTVTSVALTVPSIFTVGGSPITTSGTLAVTLNNENANLIFAGPTSGGAATPTFRSLVALDLPNTTVVAGSYTYSAITVDAQGRLTAAASGSAPTGTVTSVALTAPTEITVGGSPITTSGTLALSWTNESANKVFAGPNSGGATTPTFRAIVPLDLASGGTSSNFFRGDGVYAVPTGTGAGYAVGKDRARPAASTVNLYFASDTIPGIVYASDGTNYYVPGAGKDKVAMGQIVGGVGGFTDSTYLQSAAALGIVPGMAPGTFAFMFYVNTLPGAVNNQLAGYSAGNITNGWALKCSNVNANQMACLFTGVNSTGNIQLVGTALTTGVHCFVLTYNNSTTMKFCLDGGTVNTATVSGSFTAPTSAAVFGIGHFPGASGLASGWFDYVGFSGWNSVLSNAEMQSVSASFASFRFGNNATDPDFFHYASGCSLAGSSGGASVFPISGAAAIRASYISGQGNGLSKANY